MEPRRIFFDLTLDQLRRLLLALRTELEEGYEESDVAEHCAAVAQLADVDDDDLAELFAVYRGEPSPLVVDTFKKGQDEFEVVFMVGPHLVELLETQAKKTCDVSPQQIL